MKATERAIALIMVASAAYSPTTMGANAVVEPVCKSDGSGAMRCADPSDATAVTTSSPEEEMQQREQQQQDEKEDDDTDEFQCKDIDEKCESYVAGIPDACETHSAYMSQYCPEACGRCDLQSLGYKLSTMLEGGLAIIPFCQDNVFDCHWYAQRGECDKNPEYMRMMCEASCGICSEESNLFGVGQRLYEQDTMTAILVKERLEESNKYMENKIDTAVRKGCMNMVPDCTLWAAQGECKNNGDYMAVMCAPACMACDHLLDDDLLDDDAANDSASGKCAGLPEMSAGPLWKPGDLNALFEEIVDNNPDGRGEYYAQFNPKALSRPKLTGDGAAVAGAEKDGPWLVLLENFLSDEEADRLVQIGHTQGYDESTVIDTVKGGRTSTNTWCMEPSCREDPMVKSVVERIAKATKSTPDHSEDLQLLHYEEGQFYEVHHDFVPHDIGYPCGARVMTLFLYLNDVEGGGETGFPGLGISVTPKKGSALLWPNVLDQNPMWRDERTEHEAQPVLKGLKYGANAWIHSEEYQICMQRLNVGCA